MKNKKVILVVFVSFFMTLMSVGCTNKEKEAKQRAFRSACYGDILVEDTLIENNFGRCLLTFDDNLRMKSITQVTNDGERLPSIVCSMIVEYDNEYHTFLDVPFLGYDPKVDSQKRYRDYLMACDILKSMNVEVLETDDLKKTGRDWNEYYARPLWNQIIGKILYIKPKGPSSVLRAIRLNEYGVVKSYYFYNDVQLTLSKDQNDQLRSERLSKVILDSRTNQKYQKVLECGSDEIEGIINKQYQKAIDELLNDTVEIVERFSPFIYNNLYPKEYFEK